MKVKIEFEIELPDIEHTEDQLEEFLRFEFGDNGVKDSRNVFNEAEGVEPIFGTFEWSYA